MPEFVLRYKVPPELSLDIEIEAIRQQALEMAKVIRSRVSELFFGWGVSWEVRELEDSDGQSDFTVTGWVTDNEGRFTDLTQQVQADVLEIMRKHTFEDQTVDCWWQCVKGKWGDSRGLRHRT